MEFGSAAALAEMVVLTNILIGPTRELPTVLMTPLSTGKVMNSLIPKGRTADAVAATSCLDIRVKRFSRGERQAFGNRRVVSGQRPGFPDGPSRDRAPSRLVDLPRLPRGSGSSSTAVTGVGVKVTSPRSRR